MITGESNRSAIGTLVERTTRYVMLLHLPLDHTAEAVRDALTKTVLTLPAHLRRSLTWDQGKEMSQHRLFTTLHAEIIRLGYTGSYPILERYLKPLRRHDAATVAKVVRNRPPPVRQVTAWITGRPATSTPPTKRG